MMCSAVSQDRNSIPQADCKGGCGKSHRVTSSTGAFSFVPGREGSPCPCQGAGQCVGQNSRVVLPCFGASPGCPVRPQNSQLIPCQGLSCGELVPALLWRKGLCRCEREFPVFLLMAEANWTSGHGTSLLWCCQISPSFLLPP